VCPGKNLTAIVGATFANVGATIENVGPPKTEEFLSFCHFLNY
jgi:hypothetical protein